MLEGRKAHIVTDRVAPRLDEEPRSQREIAELVLARAERLGVIKYGDFILASGKHSNYYFDGRLLTLDPCGAGLVSEAIFRTLLETGVEAAGGPTVASVPIAGALALRSGQAGTPIKGFFVRPVAKDHGTGRQIEGPVQRGMRVAVLDDTISTGTSLLDAVTTVELHGCEVVAVVVVLDRHQGGSDEIRRRGYDFTALLEADDQGKIRVTDQQAPRRD